ncbi:MAG: stage V sporulation T C-terminal domain-containing protein [Oscillospiraceae bacterium]
MKATGIVRRIDDLGRVVIPKEIRRTMRIGNGAQLEIFTDDEGEVVFKKYSPLAELSKIAQSYAFVLGKSMKAMVAICDTEHIIAVSGGTKKDICGAHIGDEVESALRLRKVTTLPENAKRIGDGDLTITAVSPIIAQSEVLGGILLMQTRASAKTDMPDKTDIAVIAI